MKKYTSLILSVFIIGNLLLKAQVPIAYTYDDAGNRIARIKIELPAASQTTQTDTNKLVTPDELEKELEQEFKFQKLAEGNIKVYPNPTEGTLKVRLENFETLEGMEIQLYNSSGSLIERKKISSDYSELNMFTFSPGVYILRLSRGQEKLEYKIIKK